ncbi:MAG TPA: efflux RND transporter permease subunit [Gemmatimonadota bacterium]|nr:efflux RND transporter permease subunit [Gemmatimonadota bacterium]
MSLPRLAVERPIAVAMFFLAVMLLGAVSLSRMPVSLLPEVSYPRLVVWTTVLEVGPAEVERYVTRPIEEAVSAVPGVLSIESASREGQSTVTVRFPWGAEMEFAQLHVRERLDNLVDRLPQAADRPTILRIDPGAEPILIASVTAEAGGPSLAEVDRLAETVFRRRLEQLDGVGRAAVVGAVEREIRVEVDPARLAAHDLSIEEVASALDQANASAPGGTIRRGRSRYALRALGEYGSMEEIASTVVARAEGGGTIRVADLASVVDTLAERESAAYYGGRPSIGILVYRESGANAVAAARDVERTFKELEGQYPGVEIAIVTSQADFITSAIRNVVWALVLGGILAFLVLFPFLKDFRWPITIALAIPISVVGAFVLLYFSGVSLNIMSLGGLALGVGMLVDNSIVVLENVFRHRERGALPREAAARGTEEVQGAITASTLTTIAVFGPILYVGGLAGALFAELALAVTFSLLASLLVALTLVPVLAARFGAAAGERSGERSARGGRLGRLRRGLARFDRGFAALAARYERALVWGLDHRPRVLGWAGAAVAVALLVALLLPRDVLPEVDQRTFTAWISLPPGTPLETTEEVALRIDRWLRDQPEAAAVLTRIGRASAAEVVQAVEQGPNVAVIDVRLSASGGGSTRGVMERLREAFAGLPAGTLALETGAATELGTVLGTEEADLAVELRGAGLDTLRLVAGEVAGRIEGLPMLADVGAGLEEDHPELRIDLDRDAIARYGLAVETVVGALTDRTRGRLATEFVDFDRKVPVVVGLEDAERRDLDRVLSGTVEGVPLRLLVGIDQAVGPVAIRRVDQDQVVQVIAGIADGSLSGAIGAVENALEGYEPPAEVEVTVAGGREELGRSFRALGFAFLLALILVTMILAAQFESVVQPLVVLLAVPMALVGAVLALVLTGSGLNTMSLIGIVVLLGIAVNDAIIKVDFINQARNAGLDLRGAILEAGRARLRPIVMTSVTTILGLLPMAIGLGSGAELRAPIAVAVIGGMITSTVLTLLIVPVFYAWLAGPRLRP